MKTALIHVPHSRPFIPNEYYSLFRTPEKLPGEILRMTDWYTDDLFEDCGTRVIFPISRLICDVERFRDPTLENMTARGMWVCYERDSDQRPFKSVTPAHCKDVLTTWYDPHHARLIALTERLLEKNSRALIVDAHSFSSVRLPYETGGVARPDICVGTDDFHTPPCLTRACVDAFKDLGYSVAVNQPFSGCLVPMPFYRRDRRVQGVMIEINRRLYMAEDTGCKTAAYGKVKRDLTEAIRRMTDRIERQR